MKKYNLLIITPDQLRSDYLGCYGHSSIGTSHIDQLADEGVQFDNCYCQSPLCAPSRVSFATSTYVGEHGCRNYWSTIDSHVPNLVTSLKDSGYTTGMFGKNHLFTYDKLDEVWDTCHEVCLGNYDDHPDYDNAFSSFEMEKDHEYNITGMLTDEAMEFMKQADGTFLTWINYQDPHPAFTCPAPYKDMFNPDEIELPESFRNFDKDRQPVRNEVWRNHSQMEECSEEDMRKAIATYMGQIRYVDDSVGRLMKFLETKGLAENTVVLFFSDHGELLGDHGMTHKIPAFYESLVRIPAIIRHPERNWAGRKFSGLTEEVDLVPTLFEIMGVKKPPTMVGRSWLQALDSGDQTGRESILCEAGGGAPTVKEPIEDLKLKAPQLPTSLGPGAMIRKGDWKLSIYEDDRCELYNLKEDPGENRNLYGNDEYRSIKAELTLDLMKRLLGVKVRNVGINWPYKEYSVDVRFEPLLKNHEDPADITRLKKIISKSAAG
ncbi:MAG: sulfatase-like hydrolase/transferase [Verrucomicrobia bacterium]|nr:sulfatase-like hydrolase/transferase [Verrucomicrobiota bacterium]